MMIEVADLFPEDVFIGNLLAVNYRKYSDSCFYLYGTFLDKPRSGDTGGRSNKPLHSLYEDCSILSVSIIGVSGSFFRGGQQLHPAKIQSLPAEISSCQGGPFVLPSCSTKLFCQAVLPNCSANGQIGR